MWTHNPMAKHTSLGGGGAREGDLNLCATVLGWVGTLQNISISILSALLAFISISISTLIISISIGILTNFSILLEYSIFVFLISFYGVFYCCFSIDTSVNKVIHSHIRMYVFSNENALVDRTEKAYKLS